MGRAALGLLWAVLLFPVSTSGIPTEEPTPGEAVASRSSRHCRRCCDPQDPLVLADAPEVSSASPSALPYVLPEVRPYVNITILKGEDPHGAQAGLGRVPDGVGVGISSWACGRGGGRSRRDQDRKLSQTLSHTYRGPTVCQDCVNSGMECVQTRLRGHHCRASVLVREADNEE